MTARPNGVSSWIDTHAHLDDDAFAEDRDGVVRAAEQAGVATIVNIGYRPSRWATTLDLATRYQSVSFALSIHPGHADETTDETLDELSQLVGRGRPVAVGEIGLDAFHRSNPPIDIQRHAFRQQLRLARAAGLPAVIHQRSAEHDLMAVVEEEPDPPPLVLHSFDGGPRYAMFARERGCFVGVGGLATRASAGSLRSLLATIPPDRILIETDAPYLVPAGVRARRNEPAFLPVVGARLAELWGMTPAAFAAATTANARRAFDLVDAPFAVAPALSDADPP